MIKREFYPLTIATEKVGCTVDDLLYLGARGMLGIYFLPSGLQLVSEKYADDEIIESRIIDADEPLKLSRRSIELLEAGNSDALVGLDFESDATHKVRRFSPIGETESNGRYDFTAMFDDPIAHAKKVRADYSDVKISDIRLVIKHDDLMSITEHSTKLITNTGLSEIERNAVNLEHSKNDSEFNLRTIGTLALLLIEKTNTEKFGTRQKPNKKAIYTAIQQLLFDMELSEAGQSKTRMSEVLGKA